MSQIVEKGLQASAPVDFTKSLDRSILRGRTALVTGGASGIGLAIATALVESEMHVTIVDKNEAAAIRAVESLKQQGTATVQFVKTDVTSWDEQVVAFSSAAKSSPTGTVDVVVTAAGIITQLMLAVPPSLQTVPLKPPTATMDINLTGTYYTLSLALWYFTHSPPDPAKQFLFISSLAGYVPPRRNYVGGDYAASKFGVRGLWYGVREQSAKLGGARFNLLAPTFVDSPLLTREGVARLKNGGVKIASTADAMEGAMRCLCDAGVSGRAVAVASGKENEGSDGSANFDVLDDLEDHLGGRILLENLPKFFVLLSSSSSSSSS